MHRDAIPPEWGSKVNAILNRLSDRQSEVAQYQHSLTECLESLRSISEKTNKLGSPNEGYSTAHNLLRQSLRPLVAMTHDIEIVRTVKRLISDSNIDLESLVPTREIDYGFGNKIKITQKSRAELKLTHVKDCLTVEQGHLGLLVPLEVEEFNINYDISVGLTLALQQFPGPQEYMSRFIVSLPSFCESGELNKEMQTLMLEEIRPDISKYEGVIDLPRIPNFNIGFIDYYAGEFDQYARVYGLVRKRPRKKIRKIQNLPDWADSAVKITSDLLEDKVSQIIRQNGFTVRGKMSFVGNNVYQIRCGMKQDHTKKVGCTKFGIVIDIKVTLRMRLSIRSGNILLVDTDVHSNKVDIKMKPRVLGWLFDKYLDIGERILERKAPKFRDQQNIFLPSAKRASVSAMPDAVVIYMSTRRLFTQ